MRGISMSITPKPPQDRSIEDKRRLLTDNLSAEVANQPHCCWFPVGFIVWVICLFCDPPLSGAPEYIELSKCWFPPRYQSLLQLWNYWCLMCLYCNDDQITTNGTNMTYTIDTYLCHVPSLAQGINRIEQGLISAISR